MPSSSFLSSRSLRWIGLGSLSLAVLLAIGFFAGRRALESYLNGTGLQLALSEKAGAMVDAPSGFLPFQWRGLHAESGGFLALGPKERALKVLRARGIRAQCEIVDFWQRQVRVKRLAIEQLQAAVSGDPGPLPPLHLPADPLLHAPKDEPSTVKLDLQEIAADRLDFLYGDPAKDGGLFRDVKATFTQKDKTIYARGEGGIFRQAGFPEAKVQSIDLEYRQPELKVLSGLLAIGPAGRVEAQGQFEFTRPGSMKLGLLFRECAAALFLPEAMKGKFDATFESATTIEEELSEGAKATISGTVACHGAVLRRIDGLEKVAAFTHEPRLRELKIQTLSSAFRSQGTDLDLRKIEAEAKGLLRVEGEAAIKGEALSGELELGVSAHLLESFPGAREEVFTKARDGYFWTPVRLRGTTKNPQQDLKPRLVKAAEKYYAKKLLAPVLKPGEKIIEEIKELF